ncbi:MAG: restriction endonuclease subunit S, partial [Oscillospiraceae bacterium]|nr:restriction endonuclease subunit S [Oscillospiraceae bacterium]
PKTGIPQLTAPMIKEIKIPIPPLQEQNRIVKILDNFVALQNCLEEELKLRRQQYDYYRDLLFDFENDSLIISA